MADRETLKRKHDIFSKQQDKFMNIYREIALRAFSLLVEQAHVAEVNRSIEAMRTIRDQRNLAQQDVNVALREATSLEAEERMLDRAISAMERMNENASKILEGFQKLTPAE